jgi:hypothetical protein
VPSPAMLDLSAAVALQTSPSNNHNLYELYCAPLPAVFRQAARAQDARQRGEARRGCASPDG